MANKPESMMLADMLVHGEPPTKFLKALAVIADRLHPLYDAEPWIAPGKSKESCVLSSLAVRDFLWKIGFKDAEVRPVVMVMQALDGDGKQIHSLRCGDPDMEVVRRQLVPGGGWPGHMVVAVPSIGYMIDATLYQARRTQWENLPGMVANVIYGDADVQDRIFGLPLLGGMEERQDDGSTFECAWLDQPVNRLWREAGDASQRDHRANVVKQLVAAFGRWTG
ncbi:MAG: hypothetical protein E5Y88_13570 [Mesorhizobium sp.]|uniref:hypothetical protein n=1 Tax=Mesorhizobium sp. TaxID=1871066 RepID=UPI000FEA5B9C|nr:hypothetical protein [Mesorhizobium sp.]RWQ38634.1 MAG: hypothetical protein EOS20_08375 [Mesorhizobium sp.]TIL25274.1 MAG: hypothetical protein E5Y88_13570 [Mesorhizobium sp.]